MELINQINTYGYAKADIINEQEQQLLLDMIEAIHCSNLESLGHPHQSIFSIVEPDIHKILGEKKYRFFSNSQIFKIKNSQFFKLLKQKLSKSSISKKAINGEFSSNSDDEEVYFRMVRPFFLSDVGVPHADSWYHKIYGEDGSEELANSFKIWIPVFPEPGTVGLSIWPQPNALYKDFKIYKKNKVEVPAISDKDMQQIKLQPIPLKAGELLIFPPETIHCGMVNYGTKNRVSIEITLI